MQRDALHSEMAQECDVVTSTFEVSALLEACKVRMAAGGQLGLTLLLQLKMDNVEEMIDSTVRMLHELISLSEEEP